MTLQEFIENVNDTLRGTDDVAPGANSPDWNYWVRTANRKKNEMYKDESQNWESAFLPDAPAEPGTVTTAASTALVGVATKFTDYKVGDQILVDNETVRIIDTITDDLNLTVTVAFSGTASAQSFIHTTVIQVGVQTYNLHRKFINFSDKITIIDGDGHEHHYGTKKPQERSTTEADVYKYGDRPKKMTFTVEIKADTPIVGGTLVVPGYYLPDDMISTDVNAEVPVDDPYWLVMDTAGQIAFNDITYEDKFEDLNGQARTLYKSMARTNRRGSYKNPRVTPIKVKRIRGTSR